MKGWSELLLLTGVLVACWTRTPVGSAAAGAVALWRGEEPPDLLATFSTELPRQMQDSIVEVLGEPPTSEQVFAPLTPEELAVGWTPAVRTAVAAQLGEEALAEVLALSARIEAEGEDSAAVEAALETWAVGAEVRERAVRRARASGEAEPGRYASHRRFLPDEAAVAADEAVEQSLALATVFDLAWPVDPEARVSSPFGYRFHPVLKTNKLHEGVDIAVPVGTAVHAAGDGQVQRARFDKVNGNYVKLDHGHGVSSAYCHGEAMHVEKGQQVTRGQHVMDSGSTGRSTGPHLHFGLRFKGRPVDPGPFRERGAAAALDLPEAPADPVVPDEAVEG
ncbi:MAG: M23 family metallopeptidase [Alphaproteobacteria bacterium]|nr:M23 family metallopeptidase [Alphaproteobacteria bacterium]